MNPSAYVLAAALTMAPIGGQASPEGKQMEATGTFKFNISAADTTPFEKEMGAARYEIDKLWSGDFIGSSKGEMLASSTESTGAQAYVAMEQMTGKLNGKRGSFYLAHKAVRVNNDPATSEMAVEVVKSSGTQELAGLSGTLKIIVDDAGNHSYFFTYQLPVH